MGSREEYEQEMIRDDHERYLDMPTPSPGPSEMPMEPEPGDSSGLSTRCRGTGMLDCNCMGDGCCCGFHGSTECFGCPDCEWDEDDADAYYDPPDEAQREAQP